MIPTNTQPLYQCTQYYPTHLSCYLSFGRFMKIINKSFKTAYFQKVPGKLEIGLFEAIPLFEPVRQVQIQVFIEDILSYA